jgi:ribose transport system permease protein
VVASLGAIAALTLAGLVTGAIVTGLRIAPFIVTLGSMSVLRGAAKGIANEQKIDVDPRGLEELLLPRGGLFLPYGVWISLALAAAAAITLRATRFGRYIFAVGSNEATARLCGVPVERVRVLVYALAGLLAGVAGVMEFSTLTVGDPTDSVGLELEVIAAVVIGGASLSGGEGTIVGSMIGALLITVIRTGGTHLGLPNWIQEIVTGIIILAAVAVDRARKKT